VPERTPAVAPHLEAAVAPIAGRSADVPAQQCRPSPEPTQALPAASKRFADATQTQYTAGRGPPSASHGVHTALAAPQARGNWLPRPEGEQRNARQDAGCDVVRSADVQVRLYGVSESLTPSLL